MTRDSTDRDKTRQKTSDTSSQIHYPHEPGLVTTYLGDGDPYRVILATATRYTTKQEARFTGGVVATSSASHSDPIPRKPDALAQLKIAAEHEARSTATRCCQPCQHQRPRPGPTGTTAEVKRSRSARNRARATRRVTPRRDEPTRNRERAFSWRGRPRSPNSEGGIGPH